MELKINDFQLPSSIEFNFDELKNELEDRVKHYETLVYDDTQIKEAKADVAALRKLKKALNDERIRREREYMAPFEEFKAKINEIISIIDKPVNLIDTQIKAYDEEKKTKKFNEIKAFFEESDHPEWLQFHQLFDPKWLNATVSIPIIHDTITTRLFLIKQDLETLSKLPEFGFEATEAYKTTLNINSALAEGQRLADIQKRKAEQARIEEEARQKAEMERQKIEAFIQEQAETNPKPSFPEEEPANEQYLERVERADAEKAEDEKTAEWVSFRCRLTVKMAAKLKAFFVENEIEFNAI